MHKTFEAFYKLLTWLQEGSFREISIRKHCNGISITLNESHDWPNQMASMTGSFDECSVQLAKTINNPTRKIDLLKRKIEKATQITNEAKNEFFNRQNQLEKLQKELKEYE
jgi:uncharacterized coiled-coil DUF342 family protein